MLLTGAASFFDFILLGLVVVVVVAAASVALCFLECFFTLVAGAVTAGVCAGVAGAGVGAWAKIEALLRIANTGNASAIFLIFILLPPHKLMCTAGDMF